MAYVRCRFANYFAQLSFFVTEEKARRGKAALLRNKCVLDESGSRGSAGIAAWRFPSTAWKLLTCYILGNHQSVWRWIYSHFTCRCRKLQPLQKGHYLVPFRSLFYNFTRETYEDEVIHLIISRRRGFVLLFLASFPFFVSIKITFFCLF